MIYIFNKTQLDVTEKILSYTLAWENNIVLKNYILQLIVQDKENLYNKLDDKLGKKRWL
jgi:hypothetical protein